MCVDMFHKNDFKNAAYLKQSNAILKFCPHKYTFVQRCWQYGHGVRFGCPKFDFMH